MIKPKCCIHFLHLTVKYLSLGSHQSVPFEISPWVKKSTNRLRIWMKLCKCCIIFDQGYTKALHSFILWTWELHAKIWVNTIRCLLSPSCVGQRHNIDTLFPSAHLSDFDALWLGVVVVNSADEGAKVDIKLLLAVAHDGTTHSPHQGEKEQALEPQCHLSQK